MYMIFISIPFVFIINDEGEILSFCLTYGKDFLFTN